MKRIELLLQLYGDIKFSYTKEYDNFTRECTWICYIESMDDKIIKHFPLTFGIDIAIDNSDFFYKIAIKKLLNRQKESVLAYLNENIYLLEMKG